MPVLFDRTCILCGRVLPAEKRSAALCPDCAREVRTEYRYHGEFSVPGADGAAAALCYRGRVKEALHRFKFGGRPQYAAWFAAEMAAVLAAHPIARSLSLPCVSALRKRPFTARQSVQQDAAARRKNAAGSLLPGRVPLAGERVVVIDDIVATGSTAADAAHVLRSMGAACVFVLAAAKTVD